MPCETCGLDAQTKHVKFEQNIGLFYARRSLTLDRDMCRLCARRYFLSYTLTTLFLGWWGLISFILTPIFLINNVRGYWSARKLPDPGIAALNVPGLHYADRVGNRSFAFKLIYGIVVWTAVLVVVAYHQVGFMERHAPVVNAKLHQGEITDESDGEYAGLQLGNDVVALEADIKGKKWTDMRSELLARQPYLMDLDAQNDKIQRRSAIERSANSGSNDVCEQWAINELAPALNSYTLTEDKLFTVVKDTPEITSENSPSLKAVSDQQESAMKQLYQVFSDSDAKGCGK